MFSENTGHPPEPALRTRQEREFLDRTRSIWESGVRFGIRGDLGEDVPPTKVARYTQTIAPEPPAQQAAQVDSNLQTALQQSANAAVMIQQELAPLSDPASGWHSWFWGDGLNLLYWRQPYPGGSVYGIELERMAFLSDVIAALPTESAIGEGRISLADARGKPVYQWGDYEYEDGEAPLAERALGAPLEMWRLRYHSGGERARALGPGALTGLVGSLVAAGIALLGLALYFYRENTREMHEAAQKVSFVNQVSHELKTPLTNIRMYAELAGEKLDEDSDPGLERCLRVVSDESGRLSRLIGNVLSFAKKGKGGDLRPGPGEVDEVIATTVEHFRPALEKAGVEIEIERGASGSCKIDADTLEQILSNLISNVEKYAASGGLLKIGSRREGDETEITVEDRGPGVPRGARGEVFKPFARLGSALTEGASGTGIGLAIARDLARKHGGDLRLASPHSDGGCRFVLTMKTPVC